MKRVPNLIVLAAAPLLAAALWMDDQPSFKAYEAPVLAPPVSAVPVTGREGAGTGRTAARSGASAAQGKALFEINCAMCHGLTSAERGPVGKKLVPPPPGLGRDLVRSRSDDHLFNAVTSGFGRMPAFREKLTPQERWSLVKFLRTRD